MGWWLARFQSRLVWGSRYVIKTTETHPGAKIIEYNRRQSQTIWCNHQCQMTTANNLRVHGLAAREVPITSGLGQQICDCNHRGAEIIEYNRKQSSTIWGDRQCKITTANNLRQSVTIRRNGSHLQMTGSPWLLDTARAMV